MTIAEAAARADWARKNKKGVLQLSRAEYQALRVALAHQNGFAPTTREQLFSTWETFRGLRIEIIEEAG